MKRFIDLFIKSILIGIGTVIPGVSGGTVAVAAGEFESILRAVNNLFSAPKESFGYLCVFIPGAALGCVCAVYPARAFIAAAPSAANICFFAVSLLCTALFVYKSIGLAVKPLLLIAGIATASLFLAARYLCGISAEITSPILIFAVGVVLAAALVLPAVSFSYTLLFFGLYEKSLSMISAPETGFILPLAAGIIAGTFAFSKLLEGLISRDRRGTYSYVLGFVLASCADIFL